MDLFPSTIYPETDPNNLLALLRPYQHTTFPNPDQYILDLKTGYGIELIRAIPAFFSTKPILHPTKLVLIFQCDQLSPISQNALLKTIEEPGLNNYFLLFTNQPHLLLPTIRSRCQTHNQTQPKVSSKSIFAWPNQNTTAGYLLFSQKTFQENSNLENFFASLLLATQQQLISHPTANSSIQLKKILLAQKMLKHNVDPKQTLDYLFLS